jgi:hypothetical protein
VHDDDRAVACAATRARASRSPRDRIRHEADPGRQARYRRRATEKTLDEWKRGGRSDASTAELEKQVKDYEQYRASFTSEQLRAPAVWGDPANGGKRKLDAQVAALQKLTTEEQKQVDALARSHARDSATRRLKPRSA